jgi:ElaB/YqjD/DUF883 family membrane-anchored ribosome-binding protein
METKMKTGDQGGAHSVAEELNTEGSELTEMGRDISKKAAAAWQTAMNSISEKTTAGARATDRVIRDHPYEALGLAFGLGVLIGVLINRK